MAGRMVVIQTSSSEDESMSSITNTAENSPETQKKGDEPTLNTESKILHRYDREEMIKLYNCPAAKVRPSILSPEFDVAVENGDGDTGDDGSNQKLWNPELWIQSIWNPGSRQNNATPTQGWPNRRQPDHDGTSMNKKKPIDRLKTESEDGIILSPQRRSFVAGCQVATSSGSAGGIVGSQTAGVGGSAAVASTHPSRRSVSPTAGGDDRQASQHANARSSFRTRIGGANAGNSMTQPFHNIVTPSVGGYSRGDRVENWRDRSSMGPSSGRGGGGGGGGFVKDSPAAINTYSRSRIGMNSWNTGGGRRSYDRGGYNESDMLPEWVTEGPADMYETMELRGFDDEERQQMRAEHGIGRGGEKYIDYMEKKSSIGHADSAMDSFKQRMSDNKENQSVKRDSKSPPMHQHMKALMSGDKIIGKVSAEALVDGFDIGDMAEFLVAAAPGDFDSIKNGELPQGRTSSLIGKGSGQVPATPTAASRFSKFFAHSSQMPAGAASSDTDKTSGQSASQKPQQQSVNIMELFSKAAMAGDTKRVVPELPSATSVPAGAISLDEIEAGYKATASAQKAEAASSPSKVLQELFQSARTANVPPLPGGPTDAQISGNQQQKGEQQAKTNQLPDLVGQQQAPDLLQKQFPNMATGAGSVVTKGNPLADPTQQQHFLEQLRKLQVQQQVQQPGSQQHPADMAHRHPGVAGASDVVNPLMAAYPQLAGLSHLMQQQQLQAALANSGRVPSPLASGIPPSMAHSGPGPASAAAAGISPAFAGFLPPPNVPPPPITQQDLLLAAHNQSIYQRAMLNRKMQEDQQPRPPAPLPHPTVAPPNKLPTAFLPTSVIKQLHSGTKPSKDGSEESNVAGPRPIVKQQQIVAPSQPTEQISPNSVNDSLRSLQQQRAASKAVPPGAMPGNAMGVQVAPMAPPPSLTPQDLQRLIDQTQLQQQRQQQERLILEQLKAQQQQQLGNNPAAAAAAAINPAAVSAALALQNNPMVVQMLRAQAMQAQQMAMLQQQAAAAAAKQVPPQRIPATAAVSAIPNAAQLVRAGLPAPAPPPAAAASNPELMRHMLQQQQQQQQQQMLLNQLRQQAPAEANLLLNRLLTGQMAQQQQHMHQMPPSASSLGGLQFPAPFTGDAKPMTVEELERLHKQAAMQQPQS